MSDERVDTPIRKRATVLGAGAWGTTIASLLAARNETTIWAREGSVVDAINRRHENPTFLMGAVHPELRAVEDVASALEGAEAVFVAVPAQHYRSVLEAAAPAIGAGVTVLSLAKGLEHGTLLRMSEVSAAVLVGHDPDRIGVLSGPNIAREVHAGQPAATVVAVPGRDPARDVLSMLSTDTLRVFVNADVIGCEIGGVVKNVIAVAAGMAAGLGFGQNTLAALVTRGLAELTRLGIALGGDPLTFLGLAGIGDLSVTCSSPDSRNHHVGVELGRGRDLSTVLGEMHAVAEGVRSCEPVLALAARHGVELPICEQVGAVLSGTSTVAGAVRDLLGRETGFELHGIR
jgi:glycerol-3-phosphate dehydrogenase (NAD(P)+)